MSSLMKINVCVLATHITPPPHNHRYMDMPVSYLFWLISIDFG